MSQLQAQLAKAGLCPQQEALALLMCSGAMQSEEPESTASIQSAHDRTAEDGKAAAHAAGWEAPEGGNQLLGCNSSTAAIRLAQVMQEHVGAADSPIVSGGVEEPNLHKKYKEWLEQLGPQKVWELTQEAIHLHYYGKEHLGGTCLVPW
jgi:hypothetical protein